MLGTEVSVALTVALLPVVVWCTTCALRGSTHGGPDPVPVDAEVWHAVMGLVMLLTLWTTASGDWGWAGAGLFVAAATWGVMRAWGHPKPGHYRRLGVMSLAMVAMLVPTAAGAATPHHTSSMAMAGTATGTATDGPWLSGPGAWVVALVLALVALSALVAAHRTAPRRARVLAGCEVVMATAMVVAALAMA